MSVGEAITMNTTEFRKYAHELVDWMADYLENIREFPVRPAVTPGDITAQLPAEAPVNGETFEQIFLRNRSKYDLNRVIHAFYFVVSHIKYSPCIALFLLC